MLYIFLQLRTFRQAGICCWGDGGPWLLITSFTLDWFLLSSNSIVLFVWIGSTFPIWRPNPMTEFRRFFPRSGKVISPQREASISTKYIRHKNIFTKSLTNGTHIEADIVSSQPKKAHTIYWNFKKKKQSLDDSALNVRWGKPYAPSWI